MQHLEFTFPGVTPGPTAAGAESAAPGAAAAETLVGVVASGNLEILFERTLPPDRCVVQVATPATGFETIWQAVLADFAAHHPVGGLRISINDAGARPDTVSLRLAQGLEQLHHPG